MKVSKTENRFKTGFQQPKTGLPKKPVLTSLVLVGMSYSSSSTRTNRSKKDRSGRCEEAALCVCLTTALLPIFFLYLSGSLSMRGSARPISSHLELIEAHNIVALYIIHCVPLWMYSNLYNICLSVCERYFQGRLS